jgi:hypothetical protein
MPYEARDIEVNSNGRFTMVAGIDNIALKVEKFFIPYLARFVGQKTAVPLGNVLGSIQLMRIIRDLYIRTQNGVINREIYDLEDLVDDIDGFEVAQISPTEIEFKFRVVLPESSLVIGGTIPVNQAFSRGF